MDDTAGTFTFLFTDIESSTSLQRALGARYEGALATHHEIMRSAIAENGGTEVSTEGDSFFVVFPTPAAALGAALGAQRALASGDWGDHPVRVRMGIHSGEARLGATGWVGLAINHAARVAAAANGGQILMSAATASLLQSDPPDLVALVDVGEHRLKDLIGPQRLLRVRHPDMPDDDRPPRALSTSANNLPSHPGSLIGRDGALAEVEDLVRGHRLVTLTGSGGIGKTRLALEVALRLAPEFADGVWLVELAPLTGLQDVLSTVTATIGARAEEGEEPGNAIARALAGKRALLVLDNCEHLIDDAAKLAERWVGGVPTLAILATSREPLGVAGETVWSVAPLATAAGDEPSAAARLFLARATEAGGHPEAASVATVERICAHLDGIPLAIELAAACTRVLAIDQLEGRLEDRFRLLTKGSRTAPARQQTLRATIDWSHELLTETERALFRRLSVFAGGFDLAAVEAVAGGDELDAFETLDLLGRLVDTSLVVQDGGRFRLLQTIRAYATDQLDAMPDEASTVRGAHARWYARLATDAVTGLRAPGFEAWVERLAGDAENVRAALSWLLDAGEGQAAMDMTAALQLWWSIRGETSEEERWFPVVLAAAPNTSTASRARVLRGLAAVHRRAGRRAEMESTLDEALAVARESADAEAVVEGALARLAARNFSSPDTTDLIEEAEAAAGDDARLGARVRLARAATHMMRMDIQEARALTREALASARAVGDPVALAVCLRQLATIESGTADDDPAILEEGAAIAQRLGDRVGLAALMVLRARDAERAGDLEAAAAALRDVLELARESGQQAREQQAAGDLAVITAKLEGEVAEVAALETRVEELRVNDDEGLVRSLFELALAIAVVDPRRAVVLLEEAAGRSHDVMPLMAAVALASIVDIETFHGNLDDATAATARMRAVADSLQGGALEVLCDVTEAEVHRQRGDLERALDLETEPVAVAVAGSSPLFGMSGVAEMTLSHALRVDRPDDAARLAGVMTVLETDTPSAIERARRARQERMLRERLGDSRYDELVADGAALDEAGRSELMATVRGRPLT